MKSDMGKNGSISVLRILLHFSKTYSFYPRYWPQQLLPGYLPLLTEQIIAKVTICQVQWSPFCPYFIWLDSSRSQYWPWSPALLYYPYLLVFVVLSCCLLLPCWLLHIGLKGSLEISPDDSVLWLSIPSTCWWISNVHL